ncbi:MAG: NAD-dependent epimerase/dehydratase family protein [Rhodospirillaceae bacterium]|nr:NAD-dependent epimerase/dehydratase family protein [Rhodospirillaceae bacterium]MBT6407636.1 NAD-dependent epimerase/dehydratase family protein [Rhodospirillaceae bacterium]
MVVYRSPVDSSQFHADTRAYFEGRNVCVTGGSGFIGSHVVEQLLALGAHPIVPTRQTAPLFLAHLRSESDIRCCDLADRRQALDALDGASVVLNLAASVGGIQYNAAHPATVFQANMRTFLNVVDAAERTGIERLLVVSSACIYPRHCTVPTPETEGFSDWPEPTNAGYGWAKRMEEFAAQCYAEEHGLEVAIARPYNAYGPRDNFNPESSHVLPALILKAFESQDGTLPVWGDGQQSRSFLYVDDFARGLLEVTARSAEADPINIGEHNEVTIAETANMIAQIVGARRGIAIKPTFQPTDLTGQPRRNCDTTKLKEKLGFETQVSLQQGLEASINWFEANRELAMSAHHQ